MTRPGLAWGAAGLVLAASLGWILIAPGANPADEASNEQGGRPRPAPSSAQTSDSTARAGAHFGTALNTHQTRLPSDGLPDAFVVAQLRLTFEAMLLQAGPMATPELLKQRLAALVPQHFSGALAAPAQAMLERYVDYRVALGQLKAPADANDPGALRQALDMRQALRQRYFSPEENTALFAQDAALDRYTVARLEVQRNGQLTAAQKKAALQELLSELTPAEQASRSDALAHVGVAAQTANFDASNTSAQERYLQRKLAYSDAVAQRLANDDAQERDWQTRLGLYASALAGTASGQGDLAQGQKLQKLREQLFNSQEELRLDAALATRASR